MALTLNGSNNTIAGLAVGGLPDGVVDAGTLASNSVTAVKILDGAVTGLKNGSGNILQVKYTNTLQATTFSSATWTDVLNLAFTPLKSDSILIATISIRFWEGGRTGGEFRHRIRDTTNSSNVLSSSGAQYGHILGAGDNAATNVINDKAIQYSGTVSNGTTARTYSFQMYEESGGNSNLHTGTNSYGSTFSIMEIAA